MPISAFYQLFQSLGENEQLSVKLLRMKTVTLLALVLMTRPSGKNIRSTKHVIKGGSSVSGRYSVP